MDVVISAMKKILIFCLLSLLALPVTAEFSLDDLSLKKITDLKGWTPRYAYVTDDNLIGKTHYLGVSYFKRQGAAYEGPTLRAGFGDRGEKVNLSYTSGFSFMSVDMGLSYIVPDKKIRGNFAESLEGLGLELGLRLWVVQLIAIHTEKTSYVELAYGF
tara:strand:+ start:14456 stop:14932 length:477 start_codon:yes stop_codon:yes gene_type:complete